MPNLSKIKRQRMLEFLNKIREEHSDDASLIAVNEIETELISKKYGLIWEEHEERVDIEMLTKIPVFLEVRDKEIITDETLSYNFLLEGDNLHSLKLLEKTHRRKVDFIYIDPPYNRGKDDFIYDDNFVDKEDAFKHSKWLSFMSKRLRIAYKLLHSEGVIFISIDDNEMAQLKMLCNDIFGDDNCIGVLIQNKLNAKNDTLNIQRNHEYILVYRKQANYISGTKEKPTLLSNAYKVKSILRDGNRYYYLNDSITTRGEGGVLNARQNLGYTIYYNPATKDKVAVCDYDVELAKTSNDADELYTDNVELISKGYAPIRPPKVRGQLGCWTWELDKFNSDKDLIVITESKRSKSYTVKKRTFVDKKQVYEKDGKLLYNHYSEGNSKSIIEFSTNDGSTVLNAVLGKSGAFNNPKNVDMIKYFLSIFPKKDALVLDFFAGSGTTAQAVLEMNRNDGGERKFILCTNNQNDICEKVTYHRVSNIISGYNYQGKKENILFEKELAFQDLSEGTVLLETIKTIESSNKDKFSEIITQFKDGVLKVIGRDNVSEKIEGIPANLKYYMTEFILKRSDDLDYSVNDRLLSHIVEMVQLEYAVNLNGTNYILVLSDEEADALFADSNKLINCRGLFISTSVLLTAKQERQLTEADIPVFTIPDYYFEPELLEVGER